MTQKRFSIALSTIAVMGITLVSAILGFGRESYVAYAFGATGMTDVFYVASIIPQLLATWIAYTLTNALIPVLKEELQNSAKSAKRLIRTVFCWAALCLTAGSVLVFFLRNLVISGLAPGFSNLQHHEAVHLLVIMLLSVMFFGLTGVLEGIHNVYDHYAYPSMIGIVYNIVILFVSIAWNHKIGIEALGYGVLAGAVCTCVVQAVPLMWAGILRLRWRIRHPRIGTIGRSIPFIFVSYGVSTINQVVDRMLASGLTAGQISALNFASKLGMLPASIIGMAIATTMYTKMVMFSLNDDVDGARRMVTINLTWTLFLAIVVGGTFFIFRQSLVSLLFERGAFTRQDAVMTSGPVGVYGVFTLFYLLPPILDRFFYARKRYRLVLGFSVASVTLNIISSLALVHIMGIMGLVVANGLSQVVYVAFMSVAMVRSLHWRMKSLWGRVFAAGIPPACVFLLGVVSASMIWTAPNPGQQSLEMTRGLVCTLTGAVLVLFYTRIRRNDIISEPVDRFLDRVLRRRHEASST